MAKISDAQLRSHGIEEFLLNNPLMSLSATSEGYLINGHFSFRADSYLRPLIEDTYEIAIEVPLSFPQELPKVTELGNRIPRKPDYHVNPDNSLCLGSPIRILLEAKKSPDITGFVTRCVVPFLYAVSYKLKHDGRLIFDELEHGVVGALKDYMEIFDVQTPKQALAALKLLTRRYRHANKLPCPCGCGLRSGKCSFRNKMSPFRKLAKRLWFREQFDFLRKSS